jgi:hypothetical protein
MKHSYRAALGLAALTVALSAPTNVAAQSRGRRAAQPAAKAPVKAPVAAPKPAAPVGWTRKTVDGQPDLQGFWSTTSSVPMERPASCGTREHYTDEEMKAGGRNCLVATPPVTDATPAVPAAPAGGRGARGGGGAAAAAATPNPHYDLAQYGLNARTVAESNRTSMITGPEGRIPPLSEIGLQRQQELAAKQAAIRGKEFDQAENRSLTERCILWNSEGPPVISPGYNSNLQIVQGKGYVMILQEMMHDARIIPTDNRPHLPSTVGQWFGDSRGHWEGDTLVVETTNYNGRNPFQRISSDKLKVTERFKRIDEATLQYEFTIDDPVWTKPWSAIVSWAKTEGPLFEYACHEGNYGMVNILNGARVQEKEAK